MIWYDAPPAAAMLMFAVLLATSITQALIALQAGEMIRDKRALRLIRLLYSLLAAVSLTLSMETLLAVASIEGGVYLPIPAVFRYVTVLPVLLLPYALKTPFPPASGLRPPAADYLLSLLLLLPRRGLPGPLGFCITVFVAVWFALDAARMLVSFRAYARREITRGAIAHVIRSMDHGVCVANRRGWILETNPAFHRLCVAIGIRAVERVDEFEVALQALITSGQLTAGALPDGRSLRIGGRDYLLRQSRFRSGANTYIELALSDVTQVLCTATELEHKNSALERENRRLARAISAIEQETAALEREKLCRAAHDIWSQRLALAGLSIDTLLTQQDMGTESDSLKEIGRILESPAAADITAVYSLDEALCRLAGMYQRLGVVIQKSGHTEFALPEQEALCAVFKEAFANAVRHAYARSIDLYFYRDENTAGVTIKNACLEDSSGIVEGRGVHDMKARIHHAGGALTYQKGSCFELQITFPRRSLSAKKARVT